MKKLSAFILCVALWSVRSTYGSCPASGSTPLILRDQSIVGEVNVMTKGDEMYVEFESKPGWLIWDIRLSVQSDPSDFPQNHQARPHASQFEIHKPFHSKFGGVTSGTVRVNLATKDPRGKDQWFLALKAEVRRVKGKCKDGEKPESHELSRKDRSAHDSSHGNHSEHENSNDGIHVAWAKGTPFSRCKEGMYWTLAVFPPVFLPEDTITQVIALADESYIHIYLQDVPPGYDVVDSVNPGWCVDPEHPIYEWRPYETRVLSTVCDELPERFRDLPWDLVNYVLNHKQGTPDDVQLALWEFTGNGFGDLTPEAEAMVVEALENGGGFRPRSGQVLGILMDSGEDVQLTMFEYVMP